jgi:L-alanine-DL-glutamate epimerase-like enolase superfamily enzyme
MSGSASNRSAAAVEAVRAAAYTVPTDGPEADGTLDWSSTTAVVVTVTAAGLTGTGWSYTAPAAAHVVTDLLRGVVVGLDAEDMGGAFVAMRKAARNILVPGLVTAAISAVDLALWDLKARLYQTSLSGLFGRVREKVAIYGSGGFTTYDDDRMRDQLRGWVKHDGVRYAKIKIGEDWGRREARDLHRIEVARDAIGPDVELFVDANGAYSVKQAVRVAKAAAVAGVELRWFEEPVSSDDLPGLAAVRSMVDVEVAAGEYGNDPQYFRTMCAAGAIDCLQLDATRCGGFTGFLAGAAVADAFGYQVSAHCAPQLHAHVAAAVPNLRHVEWFADHVRLDPMLFDGTLAPAGGVVRPDPAVPGHGMKLRPDADQYRVR